MKRKRFIKMLMAQRISRNTAEIIAEIVRQTGKPYSRIKVIVSRPFYNRFTIEVTTAYFTRDFYEAAKRIEKLVKKDLEKYKAVYVISDPYRSYFHHGTAADWRLRSPATLHPAAFRTGEDIRTKCLNTFIV